MYRVELLVDDGNNYATFVVFDKEMLEMTNQHAATLFLNEVLFSSPKHLWELLQSLKSVLYYRSMLVLTTNSRNAYQDLKGKLLFFIYVSSHATPPRTTVPLLFLLSVTILTPRYETIYLPNCLHLTRLFKVTSILLSRISTSRKAPVLILDVMNHPLPLQPTTR